MPAHVRSSSAVCPIRIGWPGCTCTGPCTRCWSRYVPLVEPRSSTYHCPPRLVRRAWRELAKSSVSTSVESSARPIRIGWSPRVILVPVRGPAVTTRVRGPFWPRLRPPAAAALGGTAATRPARPPNRSARTTRNAAKMNSQSSSRKPKRKICRTISAVTSLPACGVGQAESLAVLPVDQYRVTDADHVAVDQRLPADPPSVHQGAVGGPEVLHHGGAAVEDDVDVLAADAGVGQPDAGLGAPADDVAAGGQLVPRARAVDDQHMADAGP